MTIHYVGAIELPAGVTVPPIGVEPIFVARIHAHERLAKILLLDLPDALRTDGMVGVEEALEQAWTTLKAWRALV